MNTCAGCKHPIKPMESDCIEECEDCSVCNKRIADEEAWHSTRDLLRKQREVTDVMLFSLSLGL